MYEYNKANQLLSANSADGEITFAYDKRGNIVQKKTSQGDAYCHNNPVGFVDFNGMAEEIPIGLAAIGVVRFFEYVSGRNLRQDLKDWINSLD